MRHRRWFYVLMAVSIIIVFVAAGFGISYALRPDIINDTPFYYEESVFQYCAVAIGGRL